MTRRAPFKQADLTRAVKAVRAGGMEVGEVILLPGGEIRLRSSQGAATDRPRPNDFDREFG